MQLKEFGQLAEESSIEEYEEWFDGVAFQTISIAGIKIPCVKITSKKYALRDKSLFEAQKMNGIDRITPDSREKIRVVS